MIEKKKGSRANLFFALGLLVLVFALEQLLPETGDILAVGLGNTAVTPDALGPLAAERVLVTRHLRGEPALAGLAATAAAATFNLGEGMTAEVDTDGGVTFHSGDTTLSFAPFVRKAGAGGALPSVSFRAEGDALIAEVKGDPAAFGTVENGRCSERPSALYFL